MTARQPISIVPPSEPTAGHQRRWSDGHAGQAGPTHSTAPWSMALQWPNLVATLSEQAVDVSHLVLRGLDFLEGAGRLRNSEAKALSEALTKLCDTSLRAQQITRLASGRIHQPRDRVDLGAAVRGMLQERGEALHRAGAKVRSDTRPVDVLLDPPVAATLLDSVMDWALSFSKDIVIRLAEPLAAEPALLVFQIALPSSGAAHRRDQRGRRLNDGLHWMLLRQLAASAQLQVTRTSGEGSLTLTITFPKTFMSFDGMSCVDLFDENSLAPEALANAWVLVVARDPSLRAAAAEAFRVVGLAAKVVNSAVAARGVICEARPSAVVVAFDALDEDWLLLRRETLGNDSHCPVVEITEELPSFRDSGFDDYQTTKVQRQDLRQQLASAVLFEIANRI